jgi:hypothetical protein
VQKTNTTPVLCPSARAELPGAVAFGVVSEGTDGPRVQWIEKPVPITPDLLKLTAPVPAGLVLRIAAPCQEKACCHFDGADCRLAAKLVQLVPSVTAALPPCQIRADCRWFVQEGRAACMRCPQVVTYCLNPSEELNTAATPEALAQ